MGLEPRPIEPKARTRTSGSQQRQAAIHIADRVAADYPHDLDDVMPKLAGRTIAHDPRARRDLAELLDALDIQPDQIRTRGNG